MKVCTINESKWKIEFIYSPMFEMLSSLHVLSNPEHHLQRIDWAKEMKNKLPEDLYEALMELGRITFEWSVIIDFCNLFGECDNFNIMSALDFIDDLDVNEFMSTFQRYEPFGSALAHANFNNTVKKKMVRLLKEYYLLYFEKELRFIEPLLIRHLKKDCNVCSKVGVLNFIDTLHSRIEISDNAFLFHKHILYTIPYKSINIIIIRVSSFTNPHLFMDYGGGMVQFTSNVCLCKKVENVPTDLLELMKVLADETRLKIIRKLYKNKVSTQSLAADLDLTEACISKHLKILYNADLLYKERCGNYIYYYLNSSFIDKIPLNIYEYLDF